MLTRNSIEEYKKQVNDDISWFALINADPKFEQGDVNEAKNAEDEEMEDANPTDNSDKTM
jgi:hypothetical protein